MDNALQAVESFGKKNSVANADDLIQQQYFGVTHGCDCKGKPQQHAC